MFSHAGSETVRYMFFIVPFSTKLKDSLEIKLAITAGKMPKFQKFKDHSHQQRRRKQFL